MISKELKARTKRFALEIIAFARRLPTDQVTAVLARQIVKSGSSVGPNYGSACRAETVVALIEEADQLVRIFVASINRARGGPR